MRTSVLWSNLKSTRRSPKLTNWTRRTFKEKQNKIYSKLISSRSLMKCVYLYTITFTVDFIIVLFKIRYFLSSLCFSYMWHGSSGDLTSIKFVFLNSFLLFSLISVRFTKFWFAAGTRCQNERKRKSVFSFSSESFFFFKLDILMRSH